MVWCYGYTICDGRLSITMRNNVCLMIMVHQGMFDTYGAWCLWFCEMHYATKINFEEIQGQELMLVVMIAMLWCNENTWCKAKAKVYRKDKDKGMNNVFLLVMLWHVIVSYVLLMYATKATVTMLLI